MKFEGHFLVLFTTETNRIENINISYNDTRELFETETLSKYSGSLRAVMSVANNKAVASHLNDCLAHRTTITPDFILDVHRILMFASMDEHRFHDNGERAGTWKVHDYGVGKLSVGSTPEEVPGAIAALCDMLSDTEGKDPVKVASALLCHFEHIHPFADGNGRVGRWLVNYYLASHGHTPVVFYSEDKQEYYAALEWFDREGDYVPMHTYLLGQIEKSRKAVRELQ